MTAIAATSRWSGRLLVGGLHVLAAVLIVSVPVWAVGDAIAALFSPEGDALLSTIIDVGRWSQLLRNTALVCGTAMVVAVGGGTILGLLIARTDMPARRFTLAVLLLAACIPVYVSAVAIFSLTPAYHFLESALAAGLLYGLVHLPLATLVLVATFRTSDGTFEELALLDARPLVVFSRVTVPRSCWGMVVAGTVVLLLVATDFTLTDILMVRTFAEEAYSQYALDRRRAGPLVTALPVLFMLGLVLTVIQSRYNVARSTSSQHLAIPPRRLSLRIWRWPIGSALLAGVVVAMCIPAVSLVRQIESLSEMWASVGASMREFRTSLMLAAAGATLISVPAVGLAWALVRVSRLRWALVTIVVLALSMPAPVVGISLIRIFNRPGLLGHVYDSPWIVVLGYFVRFLPIAMLLLIPAARRVPRALLDAAHLDGCDWLATQRYVVWPAMALHAAVAWLVVMILCYAEVGTTVLLAPPGWATASVRAFTLIHFGVYADLAVLALLSAAGIVAPWGLMLWLGRRALRRTHSTY